MNRLKVKTWGGFDLEILKVKQIHYKRIEVFTIRFNPKSIAISCSNLLTRPHASFESIDSSSLLGFTSIQAALLVTLRSHLKVLDHHQ